MSGTKGKAVRENIDLAFDVYCTHGGNESRTLIELERRGFRLQRATLRDWIKKYRFKERRAEVEAERQTAGDSQLSFEQKMLRKLIKQIEKYERYFETTDIDNQAMYAYTNLLKTVVELSRKVKAKETDPEEFKKKAEEILESEFGIKRN